MGGAGELPLAHALQALAQLTLRRPGAQRALASAVEQLRAFDSKAHLAYILNNAAEIAFDEGRFAAAYQAAHDAPVAAEAIAPGMGSGHLARLAGAHSRGAGRSRRSRTMVCCHTAPSRRA